MYTCSINSIFINLSFCIWLQNKINKIWLIRGNNTLDKSTNIFTVLIPTKNFPADRQKICGEIQKLPLNQKKKENRIDPHILVVQRIEIHIVFRCEKEIRYWAIIEWILLWIFVSADSLKEHWEDRFKNFKRIEIIVFKKIINNYFFIYNLQCNK